MAGGSLISGSNADQQRLAERASQKVDRHRQFECFGGQEPPARLLPSGSRTTRAAGAIILAKSNMGEYASGDRSTYGGTTCNP
jgi:hypothetical protein